MEIAGRLEMCSKVVGQWRRRFREQRLAGLQDQPRSVVRGAFPPQEVAQVKAIACELPKTHGFPLSRFSRSELHRFVVEQAVSQASASTIGRKTLDYLQHAIDDLDRAREHGDKELRSNLDTAMARMREIAGDVRGSAENDAAELHETTEGRARAGDSIEVNGLPGRAPRRGQILEVLGRSGHEHYDVRWDEQHTSIFFPTEGMTVIRHHRGRTEHA